MSKSIHSPPPRGDGKGECPRRASPAPRACRQMIWLLAAAVIGCAAPSGRVSQSLGPKPLPEPAATARAFDERRDDMQFELAEARWRRNELPVCQQMLEEVLARNPAHRLANLRLAELYLSANQPRQALDLMQRFCRAHREDAEAHHLLGLSYEGMGQADRALAAYDVAASLDPEDPLVRTSLENAVAAREGHGPELRPSRRSDSSGSAASPESNKGDDEDENLVELPPNRAPGSLSTTADAEPNRLDDEITRDAALSLKGPRIEIVTVPATRRAGAARDEAAEETANPQQMNDSPVRRPGDSDKSPVRWAYELEIGEAPPAVRQDSEKGAAATQDGEVPEAGKEPMGGTKE